MNVLKKIVHNVKIEIIHVEFYSNVVMYAHYDDQIRVIQTVDNRVVSDLKTLTFRYKYKLLC